VLQLARPGTRYTWHPRLVFKAALAWERNDYRWPPPMPWEVAQIPDGWLDDIDTMLTELQYARDFQKRPPTMR